MKEKILGALSENDYSILNKCKYFQPNITYFWSIITYFLILFL